MEKTMAFLNEYVSPEDIKKYKLDEKFLRSHPEYKNLPSDFRPSWTIDKVRNIYLMGTRMANPSRDTDSWFEFLINWNGKEFFIKLQKGSGSQKLNESPFLILWDEVISIYPRDLDGAESEELLKILKEALTVRGYDGARKQIPNTVVQFNFQA
jgi:hypothetical protein